MKITKVTILRTEDSILGHLGFYHKLCSNRLWSKGDVENIRLSVSSPPEFCCDEMIHAFASAIVFGKVCSMGLNTDPNLNIVQTYAYPEGAVFNLYPINFCPSVLPK